MVHTMHTGTSTQNVNFLPVERSESVRKCDRILENLPFWHIDWSDIIIHISKEKEALVVKFHSKKLN